MKCAGSFLILAVMVMLISREALATPTISANGVVNSASYARPGFPNYGIAQGSIFIIFGQGLGPAKIVQVSSFPLPTSGGLSGTSVQVTVNGTTVAAIMLYTLATQVAAVLPSNTPIGTGTVTVTYNGQTSNIASITVVARSFGIFATNQAGSGQGVLQNVNSQTNRPFNSTTESAQPGQTIILWGTGLGPVSGNEADQPLPGDMPNVNVRVFVGGIEAKIVYRGRSGCCVGDDQIVFEVPAGVEGCNLPVFVEVDNVISNFVTMSVGNSLVCENPNALSGPLLALAQKNGGLKIGSLSVGRFLQESTSTGKVQRNDNVFATFEFLPLADFGFPPAPLGACAIIQFPGGGGLGGGGAVPRGLDAGMVTAATPVGTYPLVAVPNETGQYGIAFFPGFPNPAPPSIINNGTVLTPGTTNFTWTGGAGVGAGSGSVDFPISFQWINEASITVIDRSQSITILWTGGTKGAIVSFNMQSSVSPGVGAVLSCSADALAGTFTISSDLLSALPPSFIDPNGIIYGSFSVSEAFSGSFTSPGIDLGITEFTDVVDKGAIVIK